MTAKTQTIEVDEATAATLRRRAAAQGLTVSELVAGMTALQSAPVELPSGDIAALDRQWAAIAAGEATVAHEDVARWLETWGTPAFKPWRSR
jgi:predicted transcriptional regulator